jgi:parallel beta-helix repeat protein
MKIPRKLPPRCRRIFWLVLAISLVVGPQILHAADYYVRANDPNSADANPGSSTAPFKTIAKACRVVAPDDVVHIAPGIYREAILLGTSGKPNHPISFIADSPGTVIITGADRITSWTQSSSHPSIYIISWLIPPTSQNPADYISRGEAVIWNGEPLQQVMSLGAVREGTFFVDDTNHQLDLSLPGHRNPNSEKVEVAVRPSLFSGQSKDIRHIRLIGLVLEYCTDIAAKIYTDWHLEDCAIESCRGGILIDGNDVLLLRTKAENTGGNGFAGEGNRIRIIDCTLTSNNRRGENPYSTTGGCKFLDTNHMLIQNLTCSDNTGAGIWFDWRNRNYTITGCRIFGNHGLNYDYEGPGIFVEISQGPGLIENNQIYSNTWSGIELAESSNVVIRNNIFVDNGSSVGFRDIIGRDNFSINNVEITGNKMKDWRNDAFGTRLGVWKRTSLKDKQINIHDNTFDPLPNAIFVNWDGLKIMDLPQMASQLSCNNPGELQPISFVQPLIASRTRHQQQAPSMAPILDGARVGQVVSLPVFGRTPLIHDNNQWQCQVFDQSNRFVEVSAPTDQGRRILEQITGWPVDYPTLLKVRFVHVSADDFQAVFDAD